MTQLALKIIRKDGSTAFVSRGQDRVGLVSSAAYQEGDRIVLESSDKEIFLICQFDDAQGPALIFLKERSAVFYIPFGEKRISYSPKVFYGDKHYLFARLATEEEISSYRNLAFNPLDHHDNTTYYPHAKANVETRGEAVFAARNAIDGVIENQSHGEWPYQSWGINQNKQAELRLDFGRTVLIDRLVLVTRADFPHDNWWKEVTFIFSDKSQLVSPLVKTDAPQVINLEEKKISWLVLKNLIQADDPSPFPALTQIEVYGREKTGR